MPTFLVTSKMSLELAARVRASVSGRAPAHAARPRRTTLLRLALVVGVLGCAAALWHSVREAERQLAAARADLKGRIAEERRARPAGYEELLPRAEAILLGNARQPSDTPLALAALALRTALARPSLYVRGPLRDFESSAGITSAAGETRKDAFLACLLEPPGTLEPQALLEKVRGVYRGGVFSRPPLDRAQLLQSLLASDAYLGPDFSDRIDGTKHPEQVARLARVFDQAQLPRLRPAAGAQILVYAFDEPKRPGTVTEIDGASDHLVRIGIVDLTTSSQLLRLRLRVDPSRFTEKNQARYLLGLTDCQLALDVHAAGATSR